MRKTTIALIAVGVLVGIPIALSAIGTFNSAATAPSRVATKTLETDNIIQSYERFFALDAQFKSRTAQIEAHEVLIGNASSERALERLTMEMLAMQQSCREIANDYNADAAKLNKAMFRDNDLPEELDADLCEVNDA